MTDYISRDRAVLHLNDVALTVAPYRASNEANADAANIYHGVKLAMEALESLPAADVAPVVRCGKCKHYVPAEDDSEMMCVKDADWCVEDGCYYGFSEFHDADWFCADGEMKDGDGDV